MEQNPINSIGRQALSTRKNTKRARERGEWRETRLELHKNRRTEPSGGKCPQSEGSHKNEISTAAHTHIYGTGEGLSGGGYILIGIPCAACFQNCRATLVACPKALHVRHNQSATAAAIDPSAFPHPYSSSYSLVTAVYFDFFTDLKSFTWIINVAHIRGKA